MNYSCVVDLNISINNDSNEVVQDLILKLTEIGAVKQDDARELFILAERIKGNGIIG